MNTDMSPVIRHAPTTPLTLLEKRWLRAIADDPRMRLFDVSFPELDGIAPLFTQEDHAVFDRYLDGDPYQDERYIRNFRLMREAMQTRRPVKVTMENRHGRQMYMRFYPVGFEYSQKDDKIRIVADKCRFDRFNLARIDDCEFYTGNGSWRIEPKHDRKMELTLRITDERNALDRAMLHFAHFEKQAERLDEKHYLLRLTYYESDETEIVIRILSFGPFVEVLSPQEFVELIKERLVSQKSCGLF